MKKLLATVAFCSITTLVFAQGFGSRLLSSSIGYYYNKTEMAPTAPVAMDKTSTFSLSPKIGFFMREDLAVGVSATYLRNRTASVLNTYYSRGIPINVMIEVVDQTILIGPFLRLYKPVGTKTAFFGQASANYLYRFRKGMPGSGLFEPETTNTKGATLHLTPGFVFFPDNILGIEMTLGNIGYEHSYYKTHGPKTTTTNNYFEADFGLSNLTIGISLHLGRIASE